MNKKISELKKEITVIKTTEEIVEVKLPEGVYACPRCNGEGKVEIGHRDGWIGEVNITGAIMSICGMCNGTQAIIPCSECGNFMPNNSHNRKYKICFKCYTEQHIKKLKIKERR